MSDRSKAFQ